MPDRDDPGGGVALRSLRFASNSIVLAVALAAAFVPGFSAQAEGVVCRGGETLDDAAPLTSGGITYYFHVHMDAGSEVILVWEETNSQFPFNAPPGLQVSDYECSVNGGDWFTVNPRDTPIVGTFEGIVDPRMLP